MDFRVVAWCAAVAATIVNSALYLGAVFIAAIVDHNLIARNVCIAAVGATYLSYLIQIGGKRVGAARIAVSITIAVSLALGAAAGLALLF